MPASNVGWVLCCEQEIVGGATYSQTPGLPSVADLAGFVLPPFRRQGWGEKLLQIVIEDVKSAGIQQLAYPVSNLSMPTAHFLQKRGFICTHQEWVLGCNVANLPSPSKLPAGYTTSFRGDLAVAPLFRQLYDEIFSPFAWYQPYEDAGIRADLKLNPILLLCYQQIPVGFAWGQYQSPTSAWVEPIGIQSHHQRRGLGKIITLIACHQLAKRGATEVKIGVWQANDAAIQLYRAIAFQHKNTLHYLTYTSSTHLAR